MCKHIVNCMACKKLFADINLVAEDTQNIIILYEKITSSLDSVDLVMVCLLI